MSIDLSMHWEILIKDANLPRTFKLAVSRGRWMALLWLMGVLPWAPRQNEQRMLRVPVCCVSKGCVHMDACYPVRWQLFPLLQILFITGASLHGKHHNWKKSHTVLLSVTSIFLWFIWMLNNCIYEHCTRL